MKNIKLVIFDLDGTLVDAYPAIISSFNFTMKKLGVPLQDSLTIRRAVGWGDKNLLLPFVGQAKAAKAVALYRRHHSMALRQKTRMLPGARQLLASLKKKGYLLAVASNRPTRFSWIIIRHLKLERYFDKVLCADKIKVGKPHPQILLKIMRSLHVSPQETMYIGDMYIDAQAGRRAKVKTVIVTTGSSTRQEIKREKPYRLIHNLSKLLAIL